MTESDLTLPAEIQVVVFRLGDETFALPVTMVREILDYRPAAAMPGAPGWLMGLIDVRGESVPQVDLRLRLGMAPVDQNVATRILVVDLVGRGRNGGTLVLGLVVDRVLDVSGFSGSAIEDVPDIGSRWQAAYIRSIMRRDEGFVVLLDLGSVLSGGMLAGGLLAGGLLEGGIPEDADSASAEVGPSFDAAA